MALYLTTVTRARRKAAFKNVSTEVVEDFLNAAQDWMESYCDRKFQNTNYSAVYNGDGGARLFLKNAPISSISSIVITEDDGTTETLAISTDVNFQAENGAVEFDKGTNLSSFDAWPAGFQNIAVTYTGGYATIPEALAELCARKALALYAESGADLNAALQTESIGNATKGRISADWLTQENDRIKVDLTPYRRLECVG